MTVINIIVYGENDEKIHVLLPEQLTTNDCIEILENALREAKERL